MAQQVALATENNPVDGELLLTLMEQLGKPATPWSSSQKPFQGWQGLLTVLPGFLLTAAAARVTRALICIDNDGGATRHPPHQPNHVIAEQVQNLQVGCRTCRVLHAIPLSWATAPYLHAVVVPVQALETWLLCLRGHSFPNNNPEAYFDRRSLKRSFWEDHRQEAAADKVKYARQFITSDAVAQLQRPSFLDFKQQIANF